MRPLIFIGLKVAEATGLAAALLVFWALSTYVYVPGLGLNNEFGFFGHIFWGAVFTAIISCVFCVIYGILHFSITADLYYRKGSSE